MKEKLNKSEEDWRKELTQEQFRILREKGTERAFTGEYYKNDEAGIYLCAGCGQELFNSETKYESGSGWPSYWKPVEQDAIELHEDKTFGMSRTEVTCSNCGGHLGHVFPDGPKPTGLRFCINSASLKFNKSK